jgi:hypothetical protein
MEDQAEVPVVAAELHVVNFPSIKQPLANGCYWPYVAGHDRPVSCWIYYNSTGSKWHIGAH